MKDKNEFAEFIRITGMTKRRFSEITKLTRPTVDKYITNPTMLRLKHLKLLAQSNELKDIEMNEFELLDMISNVK